MQSSSKDIQSCPSAKDIIHKYRLEAHIEGGYFREDYKSEIVLPNSVTGKGERALLTTCYYLIPRGERSIFHKLTADEIWNFHLGGPVNCYEINPDGTLTVTVLGPNIHENQQIKHLVKKGNWFGVLPQEGTDYAFFTAIVAPGFEYADWEKGESDYLKKICPEASVIIDKLT